MEIIFDKKKHALDFPVFGYTPKSILTYYNERNNFSYLTTATVKDIPVIDFALNDFYRRGRKNKGLEETFDKAFDGYAKGFIDGFATDFTPALNTPEAKKEMILKAISMHMTSGFPENWNVERDLKRYDENSFYDMGIKVGKNYKAWTIVLQTPKLFENEFPFRKIVPETPSKKDTKKNIPNSFELNDEFTEKYKIKPGKPNTALDSVLSEMLKELTRKPQPFVDKETTLPQFKKIFSGDIVEKLITWQGSVGELHFFINKLHLAKINDLHINKWKVTLLCFTGTNPKGKPFTNTMLRYANNSQPKGQRANQLKSIADLL